MDRFQRQTFYSWAFIGVLAGLSVLLAVLQYSWIGEVSRAEQDRLRSNLRTTLERLRDQFNSNISQACRSLTLRGEDVSRDPLEREKMYVQKFKQWRDSSHQERLFATITRIVPGASGGAGLRQLDQHELRFHPVEWPAGWSTLKAGVLSELATGERRPPRTDELDLVLIPLFDGDGAPLEWVALELDLNYVRSAVMPDLVEQLTRAVGPGFDSELVARRDPGTPIFESTSDAAERIGDGADAEVGLLDTQPRPPAERRFRPDSDASHDRWLWKVRHQSGSLDAVVSRTRMKNIAVTTAVLALMLLTIGALVRFTRRAQALSQLQMQFVASVSHELRTPLTVIRTAAHNLSKGIVRSGDGAQIQKYGQLISNQTDTLTALVEQVLGFANSESGRIINKREQLSVESLLEQALADCRGAIAESHCELATTIAADLPPLFGDATALRHAFQNLINNAAKYGADGGWIGISAQFTTAIEISVTDRGAGIAAGERGQIFEPFFRGRRAIDDQIHGTGLGLALVKRIVEAHGGTVSVSSGPGQRGTCFTLAIPPATAEQVDEFADITS